MINYALIMAAGRGLRMMPITQLIPKPMIDVNGTTLIARSIKQLKKQVPNIGITVGYKAPDLAKHSLEEGASMIFNTSGHGNAWWLSNTLMRYLDEPVLVLTCDNIVELDLSFIVDNYLHLGSPACMVVPVHPVEGIEGDFIFGDGCHVTRLTRKQPSDIYCSGIQVLNPASVNRLVGSEDDFSLLWQSLIDIRQLKYADIYPNSWYTVNTISQLDYVLQTRH